MPNIENNYSDQDSVLAISTCVEDINDLLYQACELVMNCGVEVNVRGTKSKEIHPFFGRILNPRKRTLLYPNRGNNPYATLFETLWVLASDSNNIDELKKFIPRATDYSDNGFYWRAGYPERIRRAGYYQEVNQLKYVYEKLTTDKYSRQAIISLWNPDFDCYGWDANAGKLELMKSKDFPCSNHLAFLVRNNKLDCTLTMRSNDAIFGMSAINFYEFSVIQELLAGMLGVEVGQFHYFVNSLHIYDSMYDKANTLIKKSYKEFLFNDDVNLVTHKDIPVFKFDIKGNYDEVMKRLELLYSAICTEKQYVPMSNCEEDIYKLCKIYLKYGYNKVDVLFEDYVADMAKVHYSDLKVACNFWMLKHFDKIDKEDIYTTISEVYSE